MVDLHSHILPGVDDGSQNAETSIKMLTQAKNAGTKAIVLTPHVNLFGNGLNLAPNIRQPFLDFKKRVDEEKIGIDLFFGGEIFASKNVLELASNRLLPTINNSRYMLVEFEFHENKEFLKHTIMGLCQMGYIPIVAHPERYDCVKNNFITVLDFINTGALIQINKGSLAGDFGPACKNAAWELVYRRMAHFVATDCHNTEGRNAEMDFVRDLIKTEINEKYAQFLFDINANTVLNNGMLMIPRPRV